MPPVNRLNVPASLLRKAFDISLLPLFFLSLLSSPVISPAAIALEDDSLAPGIRREDQQRVELLMERILLDEVELCLSEILTRVTRDDLWELMDGKEREQIDLLKALEEEERLLRTPPRPEFLDRISVDTLKETLSDSRRDEELLNTELSGEIFQYGMGCSPPAEKLIDAEICYIQDRIEREVRREEFLKEWIREELSLWFGSSWKSGMAGIALLEDFLVRTATVRGREEMARRRENLAYDYCKGAEGYRPFEHFDAEEYYQAARYHLQKVIDYFPGYTRMDRVLYYSGRVLHLMGLPWKALLQLDRIIEERERGDYYFRAVAERVDIWVSIGDFRKAADDLWLYNLEDFSHELRPGVAYNFGVALCRTGEGGKGITYLERVPGDLALYGDAQLEIARSRLDMGKEESAIKALQDLTSAERMRFPDIWDRGVLLHGYILHDSGESEKSREKFRVIPFTSSWRAKALIGIAWSFIEEERYGDAANALTQAVRIGDDVERYEALYTLGDLHLTIGEFEEAERYFSEIREDFNREKERNTANRTHELALLIDEERARLAALRSELDFLKSRLEDTHACALLPALDVQVSELEYSCMRYDDIFEIDDRLKSEKKKLAWMRQAEYKIMDISFVKRRLYERKLIDLSNPQEKTVPEE